MFDGLGESLNNGWGAIKGVGEQTWEGAKAAGKKASEIVGNVSKYLSSPGKLVDKVLKSFGVNFDFVKGDIMGGMMKGMYKNLKDSVKNLFKGWLEEDAGGGGGDGSSFTKYGSTTPYSPNKAVAGYPTSFNGGKHFGIDYSTPSGTTIKAPNNGTVSKLHDQGGGTVAKILSGKFTQFFMHLSKVMKTGKVNKGDAFAKTGNSGAWTTGPHLHYQVEKGDSPFVTNKNTVNPEKYLAGNGGGKQSASAWKTQIRSAAKRMKVSISDSEVDGISAQIQRESNGDAGVTQGNIGDINNAKGTPAQGLLQYVPSTFKSYAVKGHSNIKNGYDQLLAFFNNSNWRKDLPYGKSGWGPTGARKFATGGKVFNGLYQLGEEGYPEWIIPTDPSRADDSMKLLALAAQDIDSKNKRNKRPNQMRTPSTGGSNSQNSGLEQKIDVLISLMSKLVESNDTIANKDFEPIIDPRGMNASNHEQEAINKATRLLY
ncbi:peptidoglycan DD-metalloendopeptidase family protein [Staphylococcus pseudoxylosus]